MTRKRHKRNSSYETTPAGFDTLPVDVRRISRSRDPFGSVTHVETYYSQSGEFIGLLWSTESRYENSVYLMTINFGRVADGSVESQHEAASDMVRGLRYLYELLDYNRINKESNREMMLMIADYDSEV